jgi:hypothetical protein
VIAAELISGEGLSQGDAGARGRQAEGVEL